MNAGDQIRMFPIESEFGIIAPLWASPLASAEGATRSNELRAPASDDIPLVRSGFFSRDAVQQLIEQVAISCGYLRLRR